MYYQIIDSTIKGRKFGHLTLVINDNSFKKIK